MDAGTAEPTSPAKASSRLFLWIGLGVGAFFVLTIAGAVLVFGNLAARVESETPADGAQEGWGPIGCGGTCLTEEDALSLIPGEDALAALGGPELMPGMKPGLRFTAGEIYDQAKMQYAQGGGRPFGCGFALAFGPTTVANTTLSIERDDVVIDLGTYGDETNSIFQAVRIFDSPGAGNAYPAQLREDVANCPDYEVDLGGPAPYIANVTPVEFAVAPGATTAVAWRERAADGSTFTVVDLQYSNLVIRTILTRYSTGAIDDDEFAAFVLETSRSLAALGPEFQFTPDGACAANCFTGDDVPALAPRAADLESLGGLEPNPDHVVGPPRTIGVIADGITAEFALDSGSPQSCAFVAADVAMSPTSPSVSTREDLVYDLGGYGTDDVLTQTVRVFESSIWASRFLSSEDPGLRECATMMVNGVSTAIEPLEFDTAEGVTASGWTATTATGVTTTADLRIGTVVVRTVLAAGPGTITEEQFAAFVLETSRRLAEAGADL